MTQQEEIELEEILLAYLRASKKIKLAKLNVEPINNGKTYTLQFNVDADFPGNLISPVNNPFSDLLKYT